MCLHCLLYTSRRYSDLPVIFLTAVDDEDSVVNGLELGADDYITKYLLQDEDGNVKLAHSISAGLDYPGAVK